MNYIPEIGDSVIAKRKVRSKIYHNLVVGPVISVFENACRVVTNKGTDIETDWQLNYSEWDVQRIEFIPRVSI